MASLCKNTTLCTVSLFNVLSILTLNSSPYCSYCEACKPIENGLLEIDGLLVNDHFQRFNIRSKRSKMEKVLMLLKDMVEFHIGKEKTRNSHRKCRAFRKLNCFLRSTSPKVVDVIEGTESAMY